MEINASQNGCWFKLQSYTSDSANCMTRLISFFFVGLWGVLAAAQPAQEVWVDGQYQNSVQLPDSAAIHHWVTAFVRDQRLKGKLFFRLDSAVGDRLYFGGAQEYQLKEAVFVMDTVRTSTPLSKKSLNEQIRFWMETYTTQGYPFVQLQIDSLRTWDGRFSVHAHLDAGPQIFFDSLRFTPASGLSEHYWSKLTGIRTGELYNEQLVQDLPDRVARNPWIRFTRPPEVIFEEDRAVIQIHVEESPQNTFEGILGILPASGTMNSTIITGYLDFTLQNLFKSAKELDVGFHRFDDQSQSLGFTYIHPYLMGSELAAQTSFQILRQDTTFLTQEFDLLFSTFIKKVNFKFGYDRLGGQLISLRPEMLAQGLADFRRDLYQIGMATTRLNQAVGVGNFWGGQVRVGAGQKVIQRNPALDNELYDDLSLRTFAGTVFVMSRAQRMLTRTSALHHEVEGTFLQNREPLRNELTRLGGLRTLRGFNEQMFFARQHLLSRLEWRQYFESNSYLLVFYDQLIYRERSVWQYPFGVGSGLALRTSGGLFNFALAWGWLPGSVSIGSGLKIHLGYASRF